MLKMTRTQERDGGLYSCLASNEAGEARRNFSVEVLSMSQPRFFSSCPGAPGGGAQEGGRGQVLSLPRE